MSAPREPADVAGVLLQLQAAAVAMGRCTMALNSGRTLDARAHVTQAMRALHIAQDEIRHEIGGGWIR